MGFATDVSVWKASIRPSLFAILMAGLLASAPVLAAKPDSPGNSKGNGPSESHGKSDSSHGKKSAKSGFHFDDHQRNIIRDYFGKEFSRGNCPPGLAKKNNGCLPPGQAKKWGIGRPLPSDITYYDLPGTLLRELGRAPDGHKYVRVAADILLIAVGTGMVVDAIEDLNSM